MGVSCANRLRLLKPRSNIYGCLSTLRFDPAILSEWRFSHLTVSPNLFRGINLPFIRLSCLVTSELKFIICGFGTSVIATKDSRRRFHHRSCSFSWSKSWLALKLWFHAFGGIGPAKMESSLALYRAQASPCFRDRSHAIQGTYEDLAAACHRQPGVTWARSVPSLACRQNTTIDLSCYSFEPAVGLIYHTGTSPGFAAASATCSHVRGPHRHLVCVAWALDGPPFLCTPVSNGRCVLNGAWTCRPVSWHRHQHDSSCVYGDPAQLPY